METRPMRLTLNVNYGREDFDEHKAHELLTQVGVHAVNRGMLTESSPMTVDGYSIEVTDQDAATSPKLTTLDPEAVRNRVVETLRDRVKAAGKQVAGEPAFLAGAMTVMDMLWPHPDLPTGLSEEIPAVWVLRSSEGGSVLEERG